MKFELHWSKGSGYLLKQIVDDGRRTLTDHSSSENALLLTDLVHLLACCKIRSKSEANSYVVKMLCC